MTHHDIAVFQETVWSYYHAHGRHDMPWRQPETDGSFDPYKIMVSEIMLQQTQVSRVVPKFEAFMQQFPTIHTLAQAPLAAVLTAWSGLGYNRRAKFLWQAAGKVVQEHEGRLPETPEALQTLPGIGPNTAGAIVAYAYNKPVIFVETNIRTVLMHYFFAGEEKVHEAQFIAAVAATLPDDDSRTWYWALMDYGTHLKQTVPRHLHRVQSYHPQSTFKGSRRQLRGAVLRALTAAPQGKEELAELLPDERLDGVLQDLTAEGFIALHQEQYRLAH